MKVTIDRNIKHALLIEEDELRLLQEAIFTKYKNLEIVAKCIDGTQLETSNIEDVISYENSNFRKIKSLTFEATDSYKERLSIDIKSTFFVSAELNIKSESDEEAVLILDKMLKRFQEMKPWYNYLARFSIAVIFLFIFLLINFILQPLKMFGHFESSKSEISSIDLINYAVFISIIGFVILFVIDWVQRQLFPRVFFLIGKQKRFMERIKFWRNILFGVIILGIIINVFSNWISK